MQFCTHMRVFVLTGYKTKRRHLVSRATYFYHWLKLSVQIHTVYGDHPIISFSGHAWTVTLRLTRNKVLSLNCTRRNAQVVTDQQTSNNLFKQLITQNSYKNIVTALCVNFVTILHVTKMLCQSS